MVWIFLIVMWKIARLGLDIMFRRDPTHPEVERDESMEFQLLSLKCYPVLRTPKGSMCLRCKNTLPDFKLSTLQFLFIIDPYPY